MSSIYSYLSQQRTKIQQRDHLNFEYLVAVSISFIVFALFQASPLEIITGLFHIIIHPDILITDYLVVGGVGAAFANAGLVGLIFLYFLYRYHSNISGLSYAAIFLLLGFSFLGKNILNIWSIILGVYLYTRYHKQKFSSYIYIAIFATAMSPIVTELLFHIDTSFPLAFLLANLTGVGLGFVIPPLSTHLLRTHQGYNLYNVGFTAGLILTILLALLKSFGFEPTPQLIWGNSYTNILAPFLYCLFSSFIVLGFIGSNDALMHYRSLFHYSGRLVTDFFRSTHYSGVYLNMGINGIFCTTLILLLGAELNGPTMGGIFTVVGFSAFGKHLKNILPILIGVILAVLLKSLSFQTPSIILALLFGTALSPIAGQFGVWWGILAGFLHVSVVLHVSVLHSGLNLYSNGFAAGLVAAILVPIIQSFQKENSL